MLIISSGLLVSSCATYDNHARGLHSKHQHNRIHRRAHRKVNRHKSKVVIINHNHIHTTSCGHYHHHNKWYYLGNHTHAFGCGHRFVSGIWVKERE